MGEWKSGMPEQDGLYVVCERTQGKRRMWVWSVSVDPDDFGPDGAVHSLMDFQPDGSAKEFFIEDPERYIWYGPIDEPPDKP